MKITKYVVGFALLSSVTFSAVAAEKHCADILADSGFLNTEIISWAIVNAPVDAAKTIAIYSGVCENTKLSARAGEPKANVDIIVKRNAEGLPADVAKAVLKMSDEAWQQGAGK